jgi:F-type H+-transporting ATPase subunit alpha
MSSFDIKNMTQVIKKKISSFKSDTKLEHVGSVLSVGDGIAIVYGIEQAMMGELLSFPHGVSGLVFNLEEQSVGVILLGDSHKIKEGDIVKSTGKIFEVPVGENLLGRVINPLGKQLDGKGEIATNETRPVEKRAYGVMERKSVDTPMETGQN